MRITFARSATKHGISRAQSLYVVERVPLWLDVTDMSVLRGDPRMIGATDDQRGTPTEVVVAVLSPSEIVVIHAMELRPKFRGFYEIGRHWQET